MIDPRISRLIQFVFFRISGLTIALEPKHTGGLINAVKLLRIINDIWVNEFGIAIEKDGSLELNQILNLD